jgi:hypothetical protein
MAMCDEGSWTLNSKSKNKDGKIAQKGFSLPLYFLVMFLILIFCLQNSEVLEFLCYFIVAHILFMFVDCSHFFK